IADLRVCLNTRNPFLRIFSVVIVDAGWKAFDTFRAGRHRVQESQADDVPRILLSVERHQETVRRHEYAVFFPARDKVDTGVELAGVLFKHCTRRQAMSFVKSCRIDW